MTFIIEKLKLIKIDYFSNKNFVNYYFNKILRKYVFKIYIFIYENFFKIIKYNFSYKKYTIL